MKFDTLVENISREQQITVLEELVENSIIEGYDVTHSHNNMTCIDITTTDDNYYAVQMFDKLYEYKIVVNHHTLEEYSSYYTHNGFMHLAHFPKILDTEYLSFNANKRLKNIVGFPKILKSVHLINFSDCSALEDFSGLSDTNFDEVLLNFTLQLNLTAIKNLSTLPIKAVNELRMTGTQYFESYSGISDFNQLLCIDYESHRHQNIKKEIAHSIEILLNKSITRLFIPDGHAMFDIIKKYVYMKNKRDHIMDCAVELIDYGFEKAAEL